MEFRTQGYHEDRSKDSIPLKSLSTINQLNQIHPAASRNNNIPLHIKIQTDYKSVQNEKPHRNSSSNRNGNSFGLFSLFKISRKSSQRILARPIHDNTQNSVEGLQDEFVPMCHTTRYLHSLNSKATE
jgi:hypothetical protein